jgi:enoyl-CoA hydratase/carnithine racemase
VRVLVLTGAGHLAFATDPEGDQPDSDAHGADPVRDACARLARFAKPVVARIRGTCAGAGAALILAADIRIAAEDSDFSLSAERAAVLGAEGPLVAAVGASQARFLLLTGQKIEAAEAHRIGLVHRVVPDAELSDSVADLVRLLIDRDQDVLRAAKQALGEFSRTGRHEPQPQHPE